ncbi:hypothetical protein RFI_11123 [Reticulomyxa filosa]|uniref:F-box domain-containing protein n=1 Tax=Reticulomyxa filosa TaxID=46433 RepID=X6NJ46_RETFI|nr:hypothetical protein RFI_11123 [Reticulomyxa filosa]|eukprot:ETO26016.1 hypothetical protein RFI_11123 [Reticulomyxa filosa]
MINQTQQLLKYLKNKKKFFVYELFFCCVLSSVKKKISLDKFSGQKMSIFPINFKETRAFRVYKQVLHRINKAQSIKELAKFVVLFDFEELKEIFRNKLNVEIEKCQKSESSADFLSVQNKMHNIYLRTSSLDEILPTAVQLHIISFLNHNSFENWPLLSKSFWRTFCSNSALFKKYTLKFFHFKERISDTSKLEKTRSKPEYRMKPRKLWFEHKLRQVMIGIVDSKLGGNANDMDRLNQFSWHGIRKWHVDGIQLKILYLYFDQRPVSCYRSVFDKLSHSDWRWRVSDWKKLVGNRKSEFEKFDRYKYDEGPNHGCICYPSLLSQDIPFKVTPSRKSYHQMDIIDDFSFALENLSWVCAKSLCDAASNRTVFSIKDEFFDRRNALYCHNLSEYSPFQKGFVFLCKKQLTKKKKKK